MKNFPSRFWAFPAVALAGAGGLALGGAAGAGSALAAFAAALAPSEWLRAKARSARPETALALGLSKFFLTALLLAAAAKLLGNALAPVAFVFGVVLAVVVGVARLRDIAPQLPPQPADLGGNS